MEAAREYYERLFESYEDVVDLNTLREMLGGVSESYVRPRLQSGLIGNFRRFNKDFCIPKKCVIDFILSEEYQKNKHKLKAQV